MPSSQQWNTDGSKTSTSKPFPLKIGNTTTIYTVKTETNITNSQVGASKLTLQDSVTARSGKTDRELATSTDGGKSWSPTKDASGNNILTQDQLKSLQPGGALSNAVKTTTQIDAKSNGASPKQLNELSNGNAATSTQSEDQQSGASPTDFNQTLSDLKIGDKSGGVRQSYGNMKYPKDAKFMTEQDCIKFTMYRYKPKKVELTSDLGAFSGSNINKGSSMGTVMLPIQPSISDSNAVSWGENDMDAISAAASAAALAGIKGGGGGLAESADTATEGIKDYKGDIQKAIAASFAGSATGANQGFLTRATGAVLNSNLELLFAGPSLRSFNFTFSMSARFKEEAEEIRKIIRFFKQGMSVKRSESALFLQTPNIFDIQYFYKNEEHKYINKIKTCALQNCVVNYTPAGNYATYDDGAMTQYDMTLTFGEIEPLFDDDYNELGENHIGY